MGDSSVRELKENLYGSFPPARNRKRFLETSEDQNEEENNLRRQNLLSEWQETLKSMGVPSKKGFTGNESQYNDIIDQGLADNFEDSLSGLGVDITTASYNMSDAMMALPSVGLFKPESAAAPHKGITPPAFEDDASQSNSTDRIFKLLSVENYPSEVLPPPSIHHLLQQNISFNEVANDLSSGAVNGNLKTQSPEILSEESFSVSSPNEDVGDSPVNGVVYEHKFQYILGAATSVAVKCNEESLTYLNQGQSYEIKVKKLGDITRCQGHFYHTKVRITFQERRMQYMEKEQIALWKNMRPGERILEVDIPLSYGISDVIQDPKILNLCEFDWEPSKEVGVYVKVNCISTEFTPKKHGGEKGVPFRILIETFSQSNSQIYNENRLHTCACQLKVFKLKGADRKHKQDREKIMKRSQSEIEKYQRQCDCTILQDVISDYSLSPESSSTQPSSYSNRVSVTNSKSTPPVVETQNCNFNSSSRALFYTPENSESSSQDQLSSKNSVRSLSIDSSASETEVWLITNRFSNLISILANFSGCDLFRLTRSELIEICGLVDGIRLFNTLHPRTLPPLLTLFIRLEASSPHYALYLRSLVLSEFLLKLSEMLRVSIDQIHKVLLEGPDGIHVHITDEVIRHMRNNSVLLLQTLCGNVEGGEKLQLLLCPKPSEDLSS